MSRKFLDRVRVIEDKATALRVRDIMRRLAERYPLEARSPLDRERYFECSEDIRDMDLPDREQAESLIWSLNILSDKSYQDMFGDKPHLTAARRPGARRHFGRLGPGRFAGIMDTP